MAFRALSVLDILRDNSSLNERKDFTTQEQMEVLVGDGRDSVSPFLLLQASAGTSL